MTTDTDTTRACPHCDATQFYRRNDKHGTATGDAPYKCERCLEPFWRPVERPTRSTSRWGTKRNVSDADLDAARRALGIGGHDD